MASIFPYPIVSLAIKDYLLSLINQFNVLSVVAGTTSGTLNAKTGTIAITNNLAAGATASFTLTNSFITLTPNASVVFTSMRYSGTGTPIVTSNAVVNGIITFSIKNDHASASINAVMYLNFTIAT